MTVLEMAFGDTDNGGVREAVDDSQEAEIYRQRPSLGDHCQSEATS